MNENYVAPFLSYAINHLWQSTLFAALAWLLVVTLLRNNRPQTRYAVWLAASIKFLVPFAALIDVGSHLGWMKFAAPKTQVTLYYAMDQVSRRAAPQFVPSALRPTIPAPGSHIPSLPLIVWTCGFFVVAIRWWLSWRRVREAVEGAAPMRMFDGIPVYSSPALRERGLEPGVFRTVRIRWCWCPTESRSACRKNSSMPCSRTNVVTPGAATISRRRFT